MIMKSKNLIKYHDILWRAHDYSIKPTNNVLESIGFNI